MLMLTKLVWKYIIGGVIAAVSWVILGLWVHPPNESPGRPWQCTRHWCHGDDDPWYHKDGPFENELNPRLARAKAGKYQAETGCGAQLCDKLAFGSKALFERDQQQRASSGANGEEDETHPLLSEVAVAAVAQRKESDPNMGFSNLQ